MRIKISSVCDVGLERTNNEDAVAVCPDLEKPDWDCAGIQEFIPLSSAGALVIVADGMGGANAGEVASALAIKSLEEHFSAKDLPAVVKSDAAIHEFLREGIAKANSNILNHVLSSPDSMGLGTTVVLLWLKGEKAYVAWCGDSRCYCFNLDEGLRLLTKDHSLVQELVDKGEISKKQAFRHPDSNIITRCLGDVDVVTEPEIVTYKVCGGDIFLLCSDGLCGYCNDSLVERIMYRHYGDWEACREALLRVALKAGGQDNISISLCATLPQGSCSPHIGLKGRMKRFMARWG